MSQFQINHAENQKYAQLDAPNTGKPAAEVPKELQNARPSSRSSGWKIAGRVALGIVTIGFSELFRLAYKGIRSLCSKSAAAPAQEPRTTGASQSRGLPQASPQADMSNVELAKCVNGKGEMPAEYKAAVDEALGDLRKQFGSSVLPASIPSGKLTSVKALLDSFAQLNPNCARDMFMAVKGAKDPVTPQALKDTLKSCLVPLVRRQALVNLASETAGKSGGLGGLDMTLVVKSLLTDPEVKDGLDKCASEGDIRKFAGETMNLEQTLSEYRGAMDDTLKDLRKIFGDVVPAKLEEALQLKDETNQPMTSKLDSIFRNRISPMSKERLGELAHEYLLASLQHRAVEKAVEEEAAKSNVKLSPQAAKSIVKTLLDNAANLAAMKKASNSAEMSSVLRGMKIDSLVAAQNEKVKSLTVQYASGLSEELRPIMHTFISQHSFASPQDAKQSESRVKAFAEHIKNWKNLAGTEKEAQEIGSFLKDRYQDDLRELVGSSTDSTRYVGNIYGTLVDDASRYIYVIQGQTMPKSFQAVKESLEKLLPNAKDQQFISKLINQRTNATVARTSWGMGLDNSKALGNGTFPCIFKQGELMFTDTPVRNQGIQLTVSEDGKTARVRIDLDQGSGESWYAE